MRPSSERAARYHERRRAAQKLRFSKSNLATSKQTKVPTVVLSKKMVPTMVPFASPQSIKNWGKAADQIGNSSADTVQRGLERDYAASVKRCRVIYVVG